MLITVRTVKCIRFEKPLKQSLYQIQVLTNQFKKNIAVLTRMRGGNKCAILVRFMGMDGWFIEGYNVCRCANRVRKHLSGIQVK